MRQADRTSHKGNTKLCFQPGYRPAPELGTDSRYIHVPSKPPRALQGTGLERGGAGSRASGAAALPTGCCLCHAASTLPGTPVPSTTFHFCKHQAPEDASGFRTEPPRGHFPPRTVTSVSWEQSGQWALGCPISHRLSLAALQSWAASPFTCEQ